MNFEERYQLHVPFSQSERGTVWRAQDAKLSREVALAIVESDAPDSLKARFEEQTAKLVPLRNANVIRVFDTGKNDEGDPYASLEIVDGKSLAARMLEGPPMRVDQAVRMAVDLLGALTALHAAGIEHGDVEPGNVFVKEAGGRVTPKIVGFGLNRAEQRAGQGDFDDGHLHVLAYASPEQAKGDAIADAAGDVYSTAAVLYGLLTGRLPRRGADADALRKAVLERNVPYVADVRAELEGPVADVIDSALAPDPKDRFESADAFSKALRAALIRMRNPGGIETVVGERSLTADASDDELSAKRAQPRARPAAAGTPKAALPAKGALPARKLPPRKETPKGELPKIAKPAAKPEEADDIGFERISGILEPNSGSEPLEFESISGLLEIPSDGPPKMIQPKLPPPAPLAAKGEKADEEEEKAEAAEEEKAEETAESEPEEAASAEEPAPKAALAEAKEEEEPAQLSAAAAFAAEEHEEEPKEEAKPLAKEEAKPLAKKEAKPLAKKEAKPLAKKEAKAKATPVAIAKKDEEREEEAEAPAVEAKAPAAEVKAEPAAEKSVDEELPVAEVELPSKPEKKSAAVSSPVSVDAELAEPADQGRMSPLVWAAGGIAAAVLIGIVAMVAMDDEEVEPLTESDAPTLEEPAPPEEPETDVLAGEESFAPDETDEAAEEVAPVEEPAAEPEPVVLTFRGVEEGATITVDGDEIDGDRVELPPSEEERSIEVTLEGYRPWTRTVPGAESAELEVELERIEREPEERPRVAARSDRPSRRATTSRRQPERRTTTARRTTSRRRPGGARPTAVSDPGF